MTERMMICPRCGRRTVIWAARPHDEDLYYCTWHKRKGDACDWSVFARFTKHTTTEDLQQLAALDAANSPT